MGKADRDTYLIAGAVLVVSAVAFFVLLQVVRPGNGPIGQATSTGAVVQYDGQNFPVQALEEGDSLTSSGTIFHVDAIRASSAVLSSEGRTRTLRIGDSVAWSGATLTLMKISSGAADVVLAPESDACTSTDAQTPLCRGGSACCGGTCVDLPDCTSAPDGPADTCGARQMYCCDADLSFRPCGGGQ